MSADVTVTEAAGFSVPKPLAPGEAAIAQAIGALDVEGLVREFREQDEFIFVPRFLPAELVAGMQEELRSFSPQEIHRVYVPFIRKAGTIGHTAIAQRAPLLYALYRAPAMLELASQLAAAKLELKNDVDAHAAALYVYQRPGDHVAFHYDDCGCEGKASYTATFGILNRTNSQVHFQLFVKDPLRPMKELQISMTAGSFVFFCGAKAHHRVTPLAKGEERAAYSFAYVREGKRLRGYRRFKENIKDAILYFGPKAIFQKNYR
jgi:hypothetical protein